MNDGYADMRRHMMDLVVRARQEIVENEGKSEVTGKGSGGAAILRNLVEANLALDSEHRRLTADELFSNIFSFLLAGHETSSHSLSFAFVLLALYPEKQQTLLEEVSRLWPGNEPVSPHSSVCEYTLAFFRETLRLWPAEPRLAKDVDADTSLPGVHFSRNGNETSLTEGQAYTLPVPARSIVMLDIWALHYNPLHWGEDVHEFTPERFLDTDTYRWPRHAYMPFSTGARGCIGMRFALAESICMLACVVRQYEVLVPADLAGKSWSEQKEVLLQWTTGVTLTPTNARVRLRRRV
ncbi:cytochrome P450 [Coniophora puteana RWD-64-598 SS2]|uniref:Cytochrome P450 n=1 Tax=Coniophora puteana (strain RWD-64-598) TaxID=741705 RepID=A0A5M3MIP6_CONPW|nr:cytochrome P450 [Coniophora puteana RWD-64-598 SS2]EIW78654.1 cytochrome P450 [Coniophora puteana RWD-64-598 SS2]